MLNRFARSAVCDSIEDFELLEPFCPAYRLKSPARYFPVSNYKALESLASSRRSS